MVRARTALPLMLAVIAVACCGLLGAGPLPAAAAPSHTVTIGVIAPIDGGLTSFGQGIRNSVQLAVKQANASEPIKGWTIKVRVLDDSSDPDKGAAAAKKLAADPNVVAVVGPYNSGVAQSVLPVLAEARHRARLTVEHPHVAHARRRPGAADAPLPELLPPRRARLTAGAVPRRASPRARLLERGGRERDQSGVEGPRRRVRRRIRRQAAER